MLHERCVVEWNHWVDYLSPGSSISFHTSQSKSTRFEVQVNRAVEFNEYELEHCSTTRETEPTNAFALVIGAAENTPSVQSLNMKVKSVPGDHVTGSSVVRPGADLCHDLATKTAVSNDGLLDSEGS